jgi:hypothetical protein
VRFESGEEVGERGVVRPRRVEDRCGPAGKTLFDDRDVVAELTSENARPAHVPGEALTCRGIEPPGVRVAKTEDRANRQMLEQPAALLAV